MPLWKTLLRSLPFATICLFPLVAVAQPPHTTEAPQGVDGPLNAAKAPAMDNESVMKMVKAGLGDDLVIQTINTQPGQYVTDADSLVTLKTAGVSDRIITAMINKGRRQLTNAPEKPIELSDVNEIGVYYKDHTGKWIAIEPEIFRINSNNREFRVLTGGVFHSTGGADRDEVKFNPVKTAPHTYQFTVGKDTGGGEYGILPPGTGNVTNGGKIYTFAIVE
jgi:hypothetical protein